MTRRAPKKSDGFSWGRFPMGDTGIVAYRLFRRDHRGVVHMLVVDARDGMSRAELACRLRTGRRLLRDHVDEIDLQAMGVAA